jgi:hypothetical protein
MNILLSQVILLYSCLICTHGYLSKEPQDIKSGSLQLLATFNTPNTKGRYPIPDRVQ